MEAVTTKIKVKKLLHIDSSVNLTNSNTRQLTHYFIENWKSRNPQGSIVPRDLVKEPVPHLDAVSLAAFNLKPEEQTEEMKTSANYTKGLINELLEADEVVIGVPMYNFSIPSSLKAYIDQISRAGLTFEYTEKGPRGLVTDKTLTIITARGGVKAGSEMDHQAPYLKTVFQFLGFTDIRFVHAEGVAMKPEESIEKAETEIQELLAA